MVYSNLDIFIQHRNYLLEGNEITLSWKEIQSRIRSGNLNWVRVGDWKSIQLTTGETVIMEVAGINTYCGYSASGTTASLTNTIDFISRDCLSTLYQMNSTNTNEGAYLGSELRPKLIPGGAIYNTLPSDLKPYIGVKRRWYGKMSNGTASSAGAWTSEEGLWIPSVVEVFGRNSFNDSGYDCEDAKQYPIFIGSERHIIKGQGNGGNAVNWWLCSPRSGFTTNFCNVSNSGNAGNNNASGALGVVLGFRTYFIFLNNSFFYFFSFGDKGNRKEKVTIINCN